MRLQEQGAHPQSRGRGATTGRGAREQDRTPKRPAERSWRKRARSESRGEKTARLRTELKRPDPRTRLDSAGTLDERDTTTQHILGHLAPPPGNSLQRLVTASQRAA